ncbi:hypothetical protein FB446DRAFT_774785 [Lentinula raphanica]|nr:hypothetical protein FB446DRAFT_774785 [Lentinula raphanica]
MLSKAKRPASPVPQRQFKKLKEMETTYKDNQFSMSTKEEKQTFEDNGNQINMSTRKEEQTREIARGEGKEIEVDMTAHFYLKLEGRNEEIFGKVYKSGKKTHVLIEDKNPGTIYIIVLDWGREAMLRRHQIFANQRETLGSRKDILAKGFLIGCPSENVYVTWRDKFGTGEEKDDLVKTWAMAQWEHPMDLLNRMSEGRDKMYGPKDEEHNGPGGIAIERMKHLKPIKGAKRAYAMGVSNQSQRDLESPASNSKRGGITTCKGEDLQREILAVVAEANVIGLDKVDSTLKAKMDHQAEMTNCPRIGTIKNKYWTSAQLNVASMNDGEEVENESMQYKKRDKKGNNGEKESAEKIADIGQFGGPHLDGGDHEGIPTAMKVLTRRNEHIESEYFTIFDLGFSWELEEFSTIYFSGLHYHSGAAAIPKATFDSEKMVYTRSTLIMYPSAHELEGDSQVALGFIPKDTMGGLLTLNKEMRDFDLHAYDTNEISTYGNYIADGLGLMDDQSYLNHFSRNMLMFLLYMVRQAPREQLMRIDKDRFLSSFTMRSGDKRIEADQWEAGPGWTGEDTQVGKKYIEDFTKLSQEELKQLWNTDSRSDTIYGNTWLAAQREEWQEHRKKMMTSIPICHATGEVENIDTKQHSSHRRILRDSATRAARKNPDRDPLALRRTKEKGKEKKRKHLEYEANKKVKEMRKKDAAERNEKMIIDEGLPMIQAAEKQDIPVQDVQDNPNLVIAFKPRLIIASELQNTPLESFAKYLTKDLLLVELDQCTFALNKYQTFSLPKLGNSLEEVISYYSILSTRLSPFDLQSTILRQDILLFQAIIWGKLGIWKANTWEKLHRSLGVTSFDRVHWFEVLVWDIYSWTTEVQQQDAEFSPNIYLPSKVLPTSNKDIFKLRVGQIGMNDDPVKFAVDKAEEWVLRWTGLAQIGKERNHALSALFITLMEEWLGPGVLSVYKMWQAAQDIVHWILEKPAGQVGTCDEVCIAVQKMQNEVNKDEIANICMDLYRKCWEIRTEEEKTRFMHLNYFLESNILTFKEHPIAWHFLVNPSCIPDPLIAVASTPSPTSLFHTRSLSPLTPLPMEVDTEDFLAEQHVDNLIDQVYLCLHLTGDDLSHVATLPQPPPKSAAEREKRIFRFISDIAQNSNQRLPFRELGESRFHVLHSSQNPYTANNLRTVSGFFSALMVRSVHHGTKFLLEHTPFYKDYEDWQKVYNIAKEKHPNDEKYFCNPAAYEQHCGPCRDPENAEGYWISANNQQYNQWLLNPKSFNDKGNFLLAVVKVLSSTGFRGIGKLTAFQIAMDYMRAGAFIATPKEFVETLIWVNAGAIKGLIRLGYLQKKEGKHDPIEVEVAFVKVLEHLRSKWDQKRGEKAASIDMIDVEHWLCKTSPKRLSRSSYYAIYK